MQDDPDMVKVPQGIEDILQAAEDECRMVMMETPVLRRWAIEQAIQTQDFQNSNVNSVIWSAQKYIDYVLKGEK